jgi:hypothetical protein
VHGNHQPAKIAKAVKADAMAPIRIMVNLTIAS